MKKYVEKTFSHKPKIGYDSLYEINNDNGVRVVNCTQKGDYKVHDASAWRPAILFEGFRVFLSLSDKCRRSTLKCTASICTLFLLPFVNYTDIRRWATSSKSGATFTLRHIGSSEAADEGNIFDRHDICI